jgi:hypothetical protein
MFGWGKDTHHASDGQYEIVTMQQNGHDVTIKSKEKDPDSARREYRKIRALLRLAGAGEDTLPYVTSEEQLSHPVVVKNTSIQACDALMIKGADLWVPVHNTIVNFGVRPMSPSVSYSDSLTKEVLRTGVMAVPNNGNQELMSALKQRELKISSGHKAGMGFIQFDDNPQDLAAKLQGFKEATPPIREAKPASLPGRG